MNITVYLGANEGNDLKALLRHMIDKDLSSEERQRGICFAENLTRMQAIRKG